MKAIKKLLLGILFLPAIALAGSGSLQRASINGGGIISGALSIFATSTEAVLVGKAGDTGDVFVVDTTNGRVGVSSTGTIATSYVLAGSTLAAQLMLQGNVSTRGVISVFSDTSTVLGQWNILKARGTQALPTIVASGDILGAMSISGFDGVDYAPAATIRYEVDGTPGSNDMPGIVKILTSLDGTQTLLNRMQVNNAGLVGISTTGSVPTTFTIAGIDTSPHLTTVSDSSNFYFQGTYSSNSAASASGHLQLRARGSQSAPTIVLDGDRLGGLSALGFDGTDWANAASISFEVDGTPGSNDMPGSIVLSTSRDSTQTNLERMRISEDGQTTATGPRFYINQLAQSSSPLAALEIDSGLHSQVTSDLTDVYFGFDRSISYTSIPAYPSGYVGLKIKSPTITSVASGGLLATSLQIDSLTGSALASTASVTNAVGLSVANYNSQNSVEAESAYSALFQLFGLPDNSKHTADISRAGLRITSLGDSVSLGNQVASVDSVSGIDISGFNVTATAAVALGFAAGVYVEDSPTLDVDITGPTYSVFVDDGLSRFDGGLAINGSTTQNVVGTVYSPTLTNVANLDGSTGYACQYSQTANTVTVGCKVSVDPTAPAASTQLGISLPIPSAISADDQVTGTCYASGIAAQGAAVIGDATNDRAQMTFISADVSNQPMYCNFIYQII